MKQFSALKFGFVSFVSLVAFSIISDIELTRTIKNQKHNVTIAA